MERHRCRFLCIIVTEMEKGRDEKDRLSYRSARLEAR